jgi:hypothetical protein
MGTLHSDLHAFLHMEVTGWGIHSQLRIHIGESHDNMVTQPSQSLLTPNDSDVTSTTLKVQILVNTTEFMLYIHFPNLLL